jgi:oligopeptide/dipeptide ABC transporter ATP-binding protein
MTANGPVLRVEGLKTYFRLSSGLLKAVDDVSFDVESGRTLCIVGESGSGKSVTALSIMRLVDPPGRIEAGRVLYGGEDLLVLPEAELESRIRGNRIGMVFQDPITSLNPAFTIGRQIAEGLIVHRGLTASQARSQVIDLLKLVGIPNADEHFDSYPHQFSGGMCQRAVIAAAIACEPDILIADEPTTALDVTIQAQILRLLVDLKDRLHSALILITHDLGVVAAMADRVVVMYAGRIVEQAEVGAIFDGPRHPYTVGLLNSVIRLEEPHASELRSIPGAPPVPLNLPGGCNFRPRCARSFAPCRDVVPGLQAIAPGHRVACHLAAPGSGAPA